LECWKLQNKDKKSNGNSQSRGEDNSSNVVDNSHDESFLLATLDGSISPSDDWILDTACTFHMSPNRDYFSSYESTTGSSVSLGDGSKCKVLGIGSIRVKLHNGSIGILSDVRHVPGLKVNLISLSTLDLKGYKYSGEGGALIVSKGSKIVIEADLKSTNLYHVRDISILPPTIVPTQKPVDSEFDDLRYMQLKHVDYLMKVWHDIMKQQVSATLFEWKFFETEKKLKARFMLENMGLFGSSFTYVVSSTSHLITRSPHPSTLMIDSTCAHVDNSKLELWALLFLGSEIGVKGIGLCCPDLMIAHIAVDSENSQFEVELVDIS
jgi:hypothetical protein